MEKTVREKGHLSQTVVMAASVEQANTVRPGRAEAVKATSPIVICVRNGLRAPSWRPQKCRAGRRREEQTRRKLKTHHTMAWRRAATVEVAIGTAVRAQDGHRPAACRSAQSGTARGRVREEQSRGPPHQAWARDRGQRGRRGGRSKRGAPAPRARAGRRPRGHRAGDGAIVSPSY